MPSTETTATIAEPRTDGVCASCPHRWADHDAIGVRYCTVTSARGLRRGCVCVGIEAVAPVHTEE